MFCVDGGGYYYFCGVFFLFVGVDGGSGRVGVFVFGY